MPPYTKVSLDKLKIQPYQGLLFGLAKDLMTEGTTSLHPFLSGHEAPEPRATSPKVHAYDA